MQAARKIVLQALPQQCAPDLQSFCYQVSMRLLATSTSFQALCFSSSPVCTPELSATTWQALPVTTRQCACGPLVRRSPAIRCRRVCGPTLLHTLSATGSQCACGPCTVSYQVPMRLVPLSTSLCRISCCCSSPSKAVTSCTKLGRASASACQHCSAMDAYACGGGSSSRHGYRDQQDMSIEGRYDTGVTACQHCSAMEAHAC